MGTTYTTAYTSPNPSATGIQKRTVADKVRWLFPGASTLFAFVSGGEFKDGNLVKKPGMLGKKMSSKAGRYEFFTYTPITNVGTVTLVDGSNFTMDTVDNFLLKRSVINARTLDVGRISSVVTATKIITVTAVSSSFTPVAGDQLFIMAPAYEEGSVTPYGVQKTEDNNYNTMQICRYPWKVTKSAMKSDNFAVAGNYMDELAKRQMIEGNILLERNFIFGQRSITATSNFTADSTLADNFGTMHGFWNFAQRSFPCNNSMSYERYIKDLPIALGNTVNPSDKMIQLCGQNIFGDMLMWIHDNGLQITPGDLAKYGVKSFKFMTSGPTIEVVLHDLFNQGAFANRAFIFSPDVLEYVHRTDRDLSVKKGIQPNDADYEMNEVLGELTCADLAGGYNSCKITDWYPLS